MRNTHSQRKKGWEVKVKRWWKSERGRMGRITEGKMSEDEENEEKVD